MNNSVIKKRLPDSPSYGEIAKRVSRVLIFYDKLRETIMKEDIKIQPFDLVSNSLQGKYEFYPIPEEYYLIQN